ncbi:MAG: Wadjet anti-phage system protein JetD domain-containing protein [Verrucomicrobiota bacterium]
MKVSSPILEALARRYEQSRAGRTGKGTRDLIVSLTDLLEKADCVEGDKYELALRQLRELDGRLLELIPYHTRDRINISKVRFLPASEIEFYKLIGRLPPQNIREAVAQQFSTAAFAEVPLRWKEGWQNWCEQQRRAALEGNSVEPFDREPTAENTELLTLLPKLLRWEGESLVRFVSCDLCDKSKRLEELAAMEREGEFSGQLRGKLGRILEKITQGEIRTLDALGIVANPRSVLAHGPLRLCLDGDWIDFGKLHGSFRIALNDIQRAEKIETSARRCLTVENETSFHELAKLRSGELLLQTSYPGSATLTLLRRMTDTLEYWHFGDSDAAGFDILRDLQKKSERNFQALHMMKDKIPFEQESMGLPQREWPFYF